MRRSASSRRKGTAWTPPSLSDYGRQFLLVRLPAHVVGVVVPSSIDHDELYRSTGRRGDVPAHRDGDEHVGRAVENECRAVDPRHRADVVEAQPNQETWEDAVMPGGQAARAREWGFENQARHVMGGGGMRGDCAAQRTSLHVHAPAHDIIAL